MDGGSRRRLLFVPPVLFALGCAAFAIDLPVARSCRADGKTGASRVPKDIRKVLALAEVFGHGIGAVGILLTAVILDPAARRRWPYVFGATLGAGLAADVVKWLLVARYRPIAANLNGTVGETFVTWFPPWATVFTHQRYASEFQSFPSAHSATAAGLAVVLSTLYPQGRWWFATLAVLAMLQRIDSSAHFPSDTLLGAALGCAVAMLVTQRDCGTMGDVGC